ncbi:hypothetical protein [Candidatus Chlamydia corallus]|nr:hypothetical protein [Candidatus Chlamydia corallus]
MGFLLLLVKRALPTVVPEELPIPPPDKELSIEEIEYKQRNFF